jgi:hypothetical protein
MLLVPQQREQMLTALRAEELGAGIFLDREEVSIASLRNNAARLLEESSFRQRARALGEAGRADGGSRRAADCILAFRDQVRARKAVSLAACDSRDTALGHAQQALHNLGELSDHQVDILLHSLLAEQNPEESA